MTKEEKDRLVVTCGELHKLKWRLIHQKNDIDAQIAAIDDTRKALLGNNEDMVGDFICVEYLINDKPQKLKAIQEVKAALNLGLKEAKDWVEAWMEEHNITI
jgi:ribosomal protein L7/L12